MAKRVLILSSSPRRGGNSDTLCDQFMLGAQESGNTVEKIFFERQKNQLLHWLQPVQHGEQTLPAKR